MQRTYQHLCLDDRQTISRMSQEGKTQAEIASFIGRSQGTVSKELSRNRGTRGYYPKQANEKAEERKELKMPRRKVVIGKVKERVIELFGERMTPKMVSMELALEGTPVSHETIYQFVLQDRYDGGDLYKLLRIKAKKRRKKKTKLQNIKISNRVSIDSRPKVVDERKRYGDWEADLIEGANGSGFLLSLYERKSRYAVLLKLESKTASETSAAIIRGLQGFRVKTITYDNGLEFAHHQFVTDAVGGAAYFCKPYHSWEKGGVENYNRNVRVFYPKGTDFSNLTQEDIQNTQDQINNWPKEVLNGKKPQNFLGWLMV